MIPLVAIVGRPNVGKSTLFNRLMRRRKAIVQDDPGVTRDRHTGVTTIDNRELHLVDTGGFVPEASAGMDALIRQQTQIAIDDADLIMLVMDARDGLLESDREVSAALRRSGKPVLHVANKVDGPKQEAACGEFYSLGASHVFGVSAEHALGLEELLDAMLALLPPPAAAPEDEDEADRIRVALVGRPNAGKSSLLNLLAGEERAIVSAQPGTTRDPIDFEIASKSHGTFVMVDTAGIRRRRSKNTTMERYAVSRAMRTIYSADIACLIIDAEAGVAEQDAKVAGTALDSGRGLVLVLNKLDRLGRGRSSRREVLEQVQDKLQFVQFAPRIFLSAKTGKGLGALLPTIRRIHDSCGLRIPTSELNQFLEHIVSAHVPPVHRGRPVRFFYITQPQANPPTFLVSTNAARGVHITYRRYMINKLRDQYGFEGAPIRLFLRQRKRNERGQEKP